MLGCGGQLQQLAVETMENAQVALSSANAMGAQETADTPLRTAQEMLVTAENAMNAGDVEQAYRLALRAYLHARIATEDGYRDSRGSERSRGQSATRAH